MRTATICKQFTFHASHILPHHNGMCSNLHGHSYKLEISYTGRIKEPCGDPDEGMVIDFQVLKDAYTELIEPHVEHQHLNDTLLGKIPSTLVDDLDGDPPAFDATLPAPLTTCENIAKWIHGVLHRTLIEGRGVDPHREFVRVTLWETPTSYARVPADRNGVDCA